MPELRSSDGGPGRAPSGLRRPYLWRWILSRSLGSIGTAQVPAVPASFALAQDGLPRVLIGTQMLAKGHDLPNLTCVVVVDSDAQLFSGDFRAIERLGQTLIQVMGRAGRADKPGSVWVQTHQPDHPVWPRLLTGDYAALAQDELALRKRAGLPPHGHMALWRARSPNAGEALQHLREVAGALRDGLPEGIRILGPTPAPMERRAGQYHAQLC